MYVQERDNYAESHSGAPGCVLWLFGLAWIVATAVGWVVGGSLGEWVERTIAPQLAEAPRLFSLQGYVAGGDAQPIAVLAGGIAAGLVLGVLQGAVLLPFLRLNGSLAWVAATTIGRTAAWVALYLLSSQMAGLVYDKQLVGLSVLFVLLAGVAITTGFAVGYPQALVLRSRVPHPVWWVFASIVGPFSAIFLLEPTLYIDTENVVRDFTVVIVAIVGGVSTAIALVDLLRRPSMQAGWMKRLNRSEVKVQPPPDTVLGSTLYTPRKVDDGR